MLFRRKSDTLAFCGQDIQRHAFGPHFGYLGPPGAGKTATMRPLVCTGLFPLGRLVTNCLAFDIKNEWAAHLVAMGLQAEQLLVSNPMSPLCTVAPDFAADFGTETAAATLAETLVPMKENVNQPFFPEAARLVLSCIVVALSRRSSYWTLRHLVYSSRRPVLVAHLIREEPDLLSRVEHIISQHAPGQAAAVLATIAVALGPIAPIASAYSHLPTFSVKQWAQDPSKPHALLLSSSASNHVGLERINKALFSIVCDAIEDLPDARPTQERMWMLVDEAAACGKLALDRALRVLRSKGVRAVLANQDLESLARVYGSPQAALGLFSNITMLGVMPPLSPLTMSLVTQQMGRKKMLQTSGSESHGSGHNTTSTSWNQVGAAPITQAELSSLGAPSLKNGIPVLARAGVWWQGRIKPSWLSRHLVEPDARALAASQQQRPAYWQTELDFSESEARMLQLPWPLPEAPPTGLFGAGEV